MWSYSVPSAIFIYVVKLVCFKSMHCIIAFILLKSAGGYVLVHGSHGNTDAHVHTKFHFHAFASLRSDEVVILKRARGYLLLHGSHGNAEIHMRTMFHLHSLQGLEVKK